MLIRTDLISIVGVSNKKESNLEQLELLKVIEKERPNIYFNLWWKEILHKNKIKGMRVSQLAKISTFFLIGGDNWIKKIGNYLTA